MDNKLVIADATPEDAVGIRGVQRVTWLATYPRPELGITREDVEAKIDKMQADGGVERLVKRI